MKTRMDAIQLLKEFAKQHGIDEKKVHTFLNQYNNPQTLEELCKMPHDTLTHIAYITYVEEPLQAFIKDEMYIDRYQTVTLEDVLQMLDEKRGDVEEELEDEFIEQEEYEEKMKEYKEIEEYILKTKFGSVVMGW